MTSGSIFFIILFIFNKVWIIDGYRVMNVDGVTTILALEKETINIGCKSDVAMAYCGFVNPSGKRYSVTGPDLNLGKCGIRIQATKNSTGIWRCHMGTSAIGVETLNKIRVRLANQIAAVRSNITVIHGKEVTLKCTTTKGLKPLRYCRFEPPKGSPFSINAAVNISNALLGKYYYPKNMSIDRGDCAVTIKKVKYEDLGMWTCGAGLDDDKEYTDVIIIEVEGFYTLSTASVTGITFGTIGIVGVLCFLGLVAWKKRSVLGSPQQPTEEIEVRELEARERTPQRSLQPSPQTSRQIPSVVVQSPSEPSSSPLMRGQQ